MEIHKSETSMLYTDDEIHEYKYDIGNNRNMFKHDRDNLVCDSDEDEMTQDEINIMTDACDKAMTTHEQDVNFFQVALIKTLEGILSEIELKWKEASPDEAVGYFDSMKIIKGYLDKAKEIQEINSQR